MKDHSNLFVQAPPSNSRSASAQAAVAIAPSDPHVDPADEKRLTGQNALILERLRKGPATNVELAELSLKYTSRVSDLRAAGHCIECGRGSNGVNVYRLMEAA